MPGDISSAAPFIVAAALLPGLAARPSTTSASTRAAPGCSTCSSGWARASPSTRGSRVAGEQIGDVEVVAQQLVATKIQAEEVPLLVDELPLFGAARRLRTRQELRERRRGAAREGDRPHRGGCRRAARDRRPRAGARRTASRSPACPPGRAAGGSTPRGDHRIAMLGAIAGSRLARGRADRGRRSGRDKLPRLLRPPRLGRSQR